MSVPAIVDSHVHLWNPAQFRYAWLDGLPALNRAFQPADFAAASATADVSKFIFVECGCEPTQSLAEVDWISALAKSEPRLKGIVAHASLERGEPVRADLEMLANRPMVKGVRRNLQAERDADFTRQHNFTAGLKLLSEFGFTFDLCIRADQLPRAAELVQCVPEVTFVLDHFGKPEVRNKSLEPWARDLRAFAEAPNAVCKMSGLTTEADWRRWQPADLKPYFDHALACFGPDRVLFGSDWPVATLATSYQRWVETVEGLLPFSNERILQLTPERGHSCPQQPSPTDTPPTYFQAALPIGAAADRNVRAPVRLKEQDWVQLFRTNAERIYRV